MADDLRRRSAVEVVEYDLRLAGEHRYGTIHDFITLNAIADAAPTRAAIAQAIKFLKAAML